MPSIWALIIVVRVRYKSNGVRLEVIFGSIDFHTRLSNTYAYPNPPNMNDLFRL
jgi:hypothetical protein